MRLGGKWVEKNISVSVPLSGVDRRAAKRVVIIFRPGNVSRMASGNGLATKMLRRGPAGA